MKNLYQVREVSTLSFDERVLQEAEDARNPLMERLKFLGIFSSNMDEFFKVRVAGIQRRMEAGKRALIEVLEALAEKARELDERFQAAYAAITQDLAAEGVRIVTEREAASFPPETAAWLREHFRERLLPSLVPIILHKNQPFPHLTDGALYFAIEMTGKRNRYALLEIPAPLPRFAELPDGNIMYTDDVIRFFLNDLFYIFEYDTIAAFEFKISRDAELDIDNDFSEGHLRKMQRVLKQRKGGRPTRIVLDAAITPELHDLLIKRLKIGDEDTVIEGGRYHNMKDLMRFPNHRTRLVFESVDPALHPILDRTRTPMLDLIVRQDILVTYPYQSFDHVIRLLREAAIDPDVEEIKMTMYRSARNSHLVNALINAAKNGKKIFVSIELLARFDEENNIQMAERLQEAGAAVVYGVPPMKVHGKLLSIKRAGTLFAGLSTGNFNEDTGRLYVDSILFTADKRLTAEVERVFDYLDQAARMHMLAAIKFKHLMVSPFNSRRMILKFIEREKAKGTDGYIFLKVNHLTDAVVIEKITEAADAGVRMDFVVRTTYSVLPHPSIRAISILDRYLEHHRVYLFGKGDDACVYMSSADLMERNLDRRVEVAFPIYDPKLRVEVIDMMRLQVADTFKARTLDETQSNPYVGDGSPEGLRVQHATHRYLLDLYRRAEEEHSK